MKVVFIEDVLDVADIGDMKEVADGYARNYLIPNGLAVLVGSASSNIIKERMKVKVLRQAEHEKQMRALSGQLEGVEVTIKARVGARERLYGSVTNADIAGALAEMGFTVDRRKIELSEPIRQLGTHTVTLRLVKDVMPTVKIIVIEDKDASAAAAEVALVEEFHEETPVEGEVTEEAATEAPEMELTAEETAVEEPAMETAVEEELAAEAPVIEAEEASGAEPEPAEEMTEAEDKEE